jgi:hypothetical protein
MVDKILPFTGNTTSDLDADTILEANKGTFESFVMIGYDKEGVERFISTTSDAALMVWWLERAKKSVLESADVDDDEWEWT